jgi:hypothetical protein
MRTRIGEVALMWPAVKAGMYGVKAASGAMNSCDLGNRRAGAIRYTYAALTRRAVLRRCA